MHYLDNASTTQVLPEVADVVCQVLKDTWGNPSSLYQWGLAAEEVMEKARVAVAKAFCCKLYEVFFTGCGSEANNIALLGAARARAGWGKHIVTTGYEHPSVLAPLEMLAKREGCELTVVAPRQDGTVDLEEMASHVRDDTVLVSGMHVNNESGAILDAALLAAEVKRKNPRTFVHIDGIQSFGKLPLCLTATQIDSFATSGHKLHAPKGVGALYIKGGVKGKSQILPPFQGGGQESGIRPGTQNVPYMAGYGKAAQMATLAMEPNRKRVDALRSQLLAGLEDIGGITLHSPPGGYPGIVFFSMPKGLRSQVMLNLLDEQFGVCVSSGSACSGGAASHTLAAMKVPEALADSALRVSFCGQNTKEDIDALLAGLKECTKTLARR